MGLGFRFWGSKGPSSKGSAGRGGRRGLEGGIGGEGPHSGLEVRQRSLGYVDQTNDAPTMTMMTM